jgi:hypothetical protein
MLMNEAVHRGNRDTLGHAEEAEIKCADRSHEQ